MLLRQRILLGGILSLFTGWHASAQVTQYSVKLTPDFARQVLHGEERIEFTADAGVTQWQKKEGLKVSEAKVTDGDATVSEDGVTVRVASGGKHVAQLKYEAAAGQGLRWLASATAGRENSEKSGFFTTFYCDAWMVCDISPAQRATIQLEIIIPTQDRGTMNFRAVGPGSVEERREKDRDHFVFQQVEPVQTYLFSFSVARIGVATDKSFSIYAPDLKSQKSVFEKTADAYAFLRAKATVDLLDSRYTQAFLPVGHAGFGQEAAGMALMSEEYLPDLTEKDDVQLMAHELAHQWWGVLVGIRSWSDFWLNEGFAEFMSDAYI